ncbi:MAG: BrnT family toxin [Dehalococcoidia bacterium]|nr:BrnT family toxin [Dehalococcoidia bacterium]
MKVCELVIEPDREEHIGRHHVSVDEVEEVIYGKHVNFRARHGYYGLVGQTESGRYLTIFIAHRGGGLYGLAPARDADDAERRMYHRRSR